MPAPKAITYYLQMVIINIKTFVLITPIKMAEVESTSFENVPCELPTKILTRAEHMCSKIFFFRLATKSHCVWKSISDADINVWPIVKLVLIIAQRLQANEVQCHNKEWKKEAGHCITWNVKKYCCVYGTIDKYLHVYIY